MWPDIFFLPALKLATWLVGKFFVFIKKVFGIMLFFRKKKKLSESSIVTKKCWRQHFREKRLLFTHLASHLSACKICTGVRGEKNIRCESILPMYLFYPWKKGWRSSFEGFKHCTAKKKCLFFLNCGHDVMNVSLTSLSLRPPLKHIDIQYVLWKYFHIFLSFFYSL